MTILEILQDSYFWVLALSINMIFSLIKPFISDAINLINKIMPKNMEIETKEERRTIYRLVLFCMAILASYIMNNYGTIKAIENSIIISGIWLAFMTELIYDIGYNTIYKLIKKKLISYME